jgi:hypothetical protein
MVVRAEGCTADEAFERLRMYSQDVNRKVADIARTLLEDVSAGRPKRAMSCPTSDGVEDASARGIGSFEGLLRLVSVGSPSVFTSAIDGRRQAPSGSVSPWE